MSIRKKLLPTFNAVASGQAATCDLPLGLKYHAIHLELADNGTASNGNATDIPATLAALIGDIRVKINGKVQRVHSGAELNAMNSVNGAAYVVKASGTAGQSDYRVYLTIYFAEPWRKSPAQQAAPAWNVSGDKVRSFQLEVDVVSGLTGFTITGFYEYEPADGTIGAITKVVRQTFAALGTTQDFNTIDRRDFLQALHLFATTDSKYVNKAKLTANGVEIHDLLNTLENQVILLGRELTPDTSATPRYDLVLDYDDPLSGALPLDGLAELTLHVEYSASAAGNMVVLIVRVGQPE